jgi:hypothetical protein
MMRNRALFCVSSPLQHNLKHFPVTMTGVHMILLIHANTEHSFKISHIGFFLKPCNFTIATFTSYEIQFSLSTRFNLDKTKKLP